VSSFRAEPEPDVEARLRKLVELAFWHNQVGNIGGAVAACEAALAIDPLCTTALSLLGCLYEKKGDLPNAVNMFERVVALNPESGADLAKLQALKEGVILKPARQIALLRWLPPALYDMASTGRSGPIILSSACVVAVLVLGGAILHFATNQAPAHNSTASAPSSAANQRGAVGTASANSPLPVPDAPKQTASTAPTYGAPSQTTVVLPQGQSPSPASRTTRYVFPTAGNTADAAPSYVARRTSPLLEQVRPLPSIATAPSYGYRPPSANTVSVSNGNVPEHTVPVGFHSDTVAVGGAYAGQSGQNPSGASGGGSNQSQGESDGAPSSIQISVHPAGQSSMSSGASSSASDGVTARATALQQRALSLQQQGDYDRAAASYQTAIAEYKKAISNGINVDLAQRGIATCETGVKICQASK
jgi:hypothetical protein